MSDALIGIIVTAILVTGGGAFGFWRWQAEQEARREERRQDRDAKRRSDLIKLSNGKLAAEEVAWNHLVDTVESQGEKIVALDMRIASCEEERTLLKEQNALLHQENAALRILLDGEIPED